MIRFTKSRHRHCGFTLAEILITMILLTAFLTVASALFPSIIDVYRTTENRQTRTSRYESAIHRLRADVWSADNIQIPAPNSVVLTSPEGKIVWHTDDTGAMIRTLDPTHETRWEEAGKDLTFERDSASLKLNETGEDPALATRLFSQKMAGGRP